LLPVNTLKLSLNNSNTLCMMKTKRITVDNISSEWLLVEAVTTMPMVAKREDSVSINA